MDDEHLNDSDEFLFADERPEEKKEEVQKQWKILVADDEKEVHSVTRMVLRDYCFDGRTLDILSAYSGEEAEKILQEVADIAIIVLDVVMETDDAGLRVAKNIREKLNNDFVRIILRTGQPGKAPERKVIMEYDINDYKSKTELTAQKMYTTITSALRSYRDIKTIEKSRSGLEKVIQSTPQLFRHLSIRHTIRRFSDRVLIELLSLLQMDTGAFARESSAFALTQNVDGFVIIAGVGQFKDHIDKDPYKVLPAGIKKYLDKAVKEKKSFFIDDIYVGYFHAKNGIVNIILMDSCRKLTELDKDLVLIFSTNIEIGLDNIYLNKDIVDTQKEVIVTLGEVVENRSKETAHHVVRIAEFSQLMAEYLGFDENEAYLFRLASSMHDVGKIGIPDSILNKPEQLTEEEKIIVKTHSTIGYHILKNSNREIMKRAAIIAHEHHERWDGSGYPNGLKGEDIHIYGRIVGMADVFESLTHTSVYKEEWNIEKVIEYIKNEKGKQFDPKLVDHFLDHVDEFKAINEKYTDN
ncbi:MAG: DUF3369 domain-containing protein [bacterium]|nr:DUF3369 domain-containing protein [bacterium]